MNFEPPIVARSQPVLYFFKTLAPLAPFENRDTYLSPTLGATGTWQQREQLLQGRARTLPPSSRADRPRSVVVLFLIVVVVVKWNKRCNQYCDERVNSHLHRNCTCCPLLLIPLRFSPTLPTHNVVFYFSLLITFPQGWCRPLCRPPLRRQCLCSRRLDYPHNALSCQRWG